jgi:hypothetical protein
MKRNELMPAFLVVVGIIIAVIILLLSLGAAIWIAG